jgi:hypothetical protein
MVNALVLSSLAFPTYCWRMVGYSEVIGRQFTSGDIDGFDAKVR